MFSVLLVSHNGERWLRPVLDVVSAQSTRPGHLLAIDTGSSDSSRELISGGPGWQLAGSREELSFPQAVSVPLTALPRSPATGPDEWVWQLHGDSAPAPDALTGLVRFARSHPGVSVLGPKLREWPDLKRLLEVGVTISGTDRRRPVWSQGNTTRVSTIRSTTC